MMDISWKPDDLDSRVASAIQLAHADILRVREDPMGSNRSRIIDAYNRESGSPVGSYWCANALAHWWRAAGLDVPPSSAGSCDVWMSWAKKTDRWRHYPVVGAAIIYGHGTDASHCGIVYDVQSPEVVFTIEGNTSLDGYSRNGELVTGKLARLSMLLGYVHPLPPVARAA